METKAEQIARQLAADVVTIPRLDQIAYSPLGAEPIPQDDASTLFENVWAEIMEFQAQLSETEEVGACLASFGQQVIIHVEDLAWADPNMIVIVGVRDDGRPARLVQHMSQLSLLLTALPAQGTVARRIGFRSQHDDDDADEETP